MARIFTLGHFLLGDHLKQNFGGSENNLNVCKKECAEKRDCYLRYKSERERSFLKWSEKYIQQILGGAKILGILQVGTRLTK